jgi:type IV secretion system protein VirB10
MNDPHRQDLLKDSESPYAHVMIATSRRTPKWFVWSCLLVLLVCGGIWSMQQSVSDSDAMDGMPDEDSSDQIASRTPVAALVTDEEPLMDDLPLLDAMPEAEPVEEDHALHDARIKSAIIVQESQDNQLEASEDVAQPASASASASVPVASDAQAQFVESVSGKGVPTSAAHQVQDLAYKLLQGKMIDAVLESRARSDLPGMVCATVSRDVYGAKERIKLVPWGARICGQYSAELRTGQERLFVVWNTLRRPDGVEVTLDSPGADQLGTAGLGGLVDTHFAHVFGVSALLSIIGASAGSQHRHTQHTQQMGAYYRESVQSAAAQSAQQLLQPYLNIKPTITVPAGARIRIYVNRDLDFSAIYAHQTATQRSADVMIYD